MKELIVDGVSCEMTQRNAEWLVFMGAISERSNLDGDTWFELNSDHLFCSLEVVVLMSPGEEKNLAKYVGSK